MTLFRVRAPEANQVWLCLFDGDAESRHAMVRRDGADWTLDLPQAGPGTRYGLRADGPWDPDHGQWFDPAKLLVDPRAVELDQRFRYDRRLAVYGEDTAALVPKAVVPQPLADLPPTAPVPVRGGLIYEANVRALTQLHPDIPANQRGTVAALGHPAIIAHLNKLRVNAVELMPLVAWIDERHLPPLGLRNAWGYNPVVPMALDPGLCPGGVAELRAAVAALHAAGIGVILDLVFNHTGESDRLGPTLSQRGLDNRGFYAQDDWGNLINDTGCGNTLDFTKPHLRDLVLDALRHFVRHCGVDGFRFDLAPVMARGPGFSRAAPIFAEIAADPLLADRVLIAEPWDIGPGGYQLGNFPTNWLEWNDRFRDDVRRFWRGDAEVTVGQLATRLAGSTDLFGPNDPSRPCRSVNFVAAHDGKTLADTVAYADRHNWPNGEDNRDGHGGEPGWNNGVEGPSEDPAIEARRAADQRALLGTLYASTGTIMLTAGDEFGRTQQGNNNAYCQDNPLTWLDWANRDTALEDHVAALGQWRADRREAFVAFPAAGAWLAPDGQPMTIADWESPETTGLTYRSLDEARRYSVSVDRSERKVSLD